MSFLRRKILMIPLLLACVGVPYFLMSGNGLAGIKDKWNSLVSGSKKDGDGFGKISDKFDVTAGAQASSVNPSFPKPQLSGQPVRDFGEILNFRVTPEWVKSRWSRVSTMLAEIKMEGMRVPVVTGTRADDLHGSLTYYFDKQHRTQRITFYGSTGDPRRLVAHLTGQHGFRSVPTLRAGLYLKTWNGQPTGALWLDHAPRVRSQATHFQVRVMLEINHPDSPFGMSEQFSEFLEKEHSLGQW